MVELAVTLVLLTGVGLMVRDFQRRQGVDLGYDATNLLVFSIALDREPYLTGGQRTQFANRLAEELEALPTVSSAGATTMFPRSRGNTVGQVEAEGHAVGSDEVLTINTRLVTPPYLAGLGASLLRGRWLTEHDRHGGESVVIVNQRLAERLWPNEDPLGRRVRDRASGADAPWHTVVGVVSDLRESDEIPYSWYRPYAQDASGRGASFLTVWARGSFGLAAPSIRAVRGALDRIDPELPVFEVTTAETLNADALSRERQGAMLGSAFALFGLLLAALGVYGSISLSVSRQTREFGIRMALGSDRPRIFRRVLSRVGIMVAIGGATGLMGAVAIARVIGAHLVETGPFDPVAFATAIVLLASTGLVAGALPAWRATRVDPVDALRAE
jgi:putative ABC transport system permease protein